MPPFATVAIPLVSRSDINDDRPYGSAKGKGKAPVRQVQKPRMYDDEPLPVKPSEQNPKDARITGRVLGGHGATYQLKIGGVELNDVRVEEILDYVSALELEAYEHRQFVEEGEVLKVLEEERARVKRERKEEKAKRKGVVIFEEASANEEDGGDEATGKRGRPRPTYTHLYEKFKIRHRRKRDPSTGELLPIADGTVDAGDSSEDVPLERHVSRASGPSEELPKRRRRRKRDDVTGDLLPLPPVAQPGISMETKKRQRRRRHPVTGDLMPVGWRYGADDVHDSGGAPSPAFNDLSIHEHDAKRRRLDTESSVSRSPSPMRTKAEIMAAASPNVHPSANASVNATPKKAIVVDVATSEDEDEEFPSTSMKPKPQPTPAGSRFSNNSMFKGTAISSAQESSSPEPQRRTSILRPTATKVSASASSSDAVQVVSPSRDKVTTTSILYPSATRASSTDPLARQTANDEESDDDLSEDEWVIEAILAHHMSDPRTHPPEFGKQAIMLYQVKWEGSDELTWEPLESFGDPSTVSEYGKRVGLPAEDHEEDSEDAEAEHRAALMPAKAQPVPSTLGKPKTQTSRAKDDAGHTAEGEYEIVAIQDHLLSDPRTHPKEFGKTPVMLYKVKWKGHPNATWEPATSFDRSVLREYHKRVGLKNTSMRGK